MKNIVVFTYGDANNPATWSNVPYLFTKTLEKKGYNVIKIDISTKQNLLTKAYSLLFKILKPSTTYYFVRSNLNRKIVEKKIKKTVNQYDEITDLYISISFDFSPSKYTKKKVLLISDWPLEYALEKRYNRPPDFLELKDIKRHQEIIESATYRISLFQDVATYMNEHYQNKTIYLGGLINSLYPLDGFENTDNRHYLTFIGKKSYYEAAKELIKAFNSLDKKIIKQKKLELHIIGMKKNDFPNIQNENIYFHGYLNKGNKTEYETYYQIIKKSLVLINTSDKWAGMSSILEVMYYYRPIITSKYEEFLQTFGEEINFGYYSKNNSKDIKKCLEQILNLNKEDYKKLAKNANKAVKNFTYDAYLDKLIALTKIEERPTK